MNIASTTEALVHHEGRAKSTKSTSLIRLLAAIWFDFVSSTLRSSYCGGRVARFAVEFHSFGTKMLVNHCGSACYVVLARLFFKSRVAPSQTQSNQYAPFFSSVGFQV